MAGFLLGGTIFPFIIEGLIGSMGLRKSLIILSALIFGIGALFLGGIKYVLLFDTHLSFATTKQTTDRHHNPDPVFQ